MYTADLEDDAVGARHLVLHLEGDVGTDAALQQRVHVLAHARRRHLCSVADAKVNKVYETEGIRACQTAVSRPGDCPWSL